MTPCDLPFASNPLRSRADVAQLLRDLVAPLVPHISPGGAQVRLGAARAHYGDPAGWLEGFARPLWGLVPLAAGGGEFAHWARWQAGLMAGSDPAHAEYWGVAGDYDQRSVESAALGFGLALAPRELWEPLPPAARGRLAAWLGRINEVQLVPSNWLFFRVLVNLGLRRRGLAWSRERTEADLAQLDTFYLGDGWYADGGSSAHGRDGRRGDYYVPMALHLYGLIYAQLAGADDPVRADAYRGRAARFAVDFQHWFSADGAALPFGRSLAYRFAQGAFWGGLAFAGVEALPWPVVKGLYLRHLRWWMQQPIFTETGLLTVGYAYPNALMAESYNSPGSPYWALKAFLPLALPESHPFWLADEAPLPPRAAVHTVPGAGLILTTDPRSRDVTAINPGQPVHEWPRHAPQKYSKAAYATRLGFAVPASVATLAEGGLDSGLNVSDDGRFFRVREHCLDARVGEGVAHSRWQPWPDIEVSTWLVALPAAHVRLHRLRNARRAWTAECGFAVGWTEKPRVQRETMPGAAVVRTPLGAAAVRDLAEPAREAECVDLGAGSHLLTSLSCMPVLRAMHEPGEHWLACWAAGSGDAAEDFAAEAARVSLRIDRAGPAVVCRLSCDGEPWWTLELGAGDAGGLGNSSPARLAGLARLG